MPFRLLERLFAAQLPLSVDDEEDIDKLFVLSATGMLEAEIPKLRRASGPNRYDGTAVVLRVTQQGMAAVSKRASLAHLQPGAVRWSTSAAAGGAGPTPPEDRTPPILLADSGNQRLSGLQH